MVGLAFADVSFADRKSVVASHRGLAMVAEIGTFFALGLLVFPSQFGPIAGQAVLLAIIIAAIAHPTASTLATIGQGIAKPDRVLLAWAALRGAVPVVLAAFAVIDAVPRSVEMLIIVFFAVLLSAAPHGATVEALANRLLPQAADESGWGERPCGAARVRRGRRCARTRTARAAVPHRSRP